MPETGQRTAGAFTEQELATIVLQTWQRALKNSQLGPDDDFFTAGGDSLLVDEVTAAIAAATGIEIPVVTLFINPTATEFADAILELAGTGGTGHDRT